MVAAVVIIVMAGVILPFVGWMLARSAQKRWPPSVHGLGPPSDAVDSWLIEHYHLPALQRGQVRNAVIYGRMVRDQQLRSAAHELAGCAVRGELRLGRGIRIGATVMVAEGAAMVAIGIIVALLAASANAAAGIATLLVLGALGIRFMSRGLAMLRRIRDGARRAYELNA
jgi:hypothetical protein